MAGIAYVDGRYLERDQAAISIDDRGYQFADSVYEVIAVLGGRLLDAEAHFDRLERSLAALRIPVPMSRAALATVLRELIRRNRLPDGVVYLQISRGVAPRGHAFPPSVWPTIVATARRIDFRANAALAQTGVAVIAVPEIRWARRDIKTTGLLPNVLARQQAVEAGAYEAWFVDEVGFVTEGAATNAWIVDADGRLITHPATEDILHGVTRRRVLALAQAEGLQIVERPFHLTEAMNAREAFITSATAFVIPVTRIDDSQVANGEPGGTATQLRARYIDAVSAEAGR